jgi:hypothetical protein
VVCRYNCVPIAFRLEWTSHAPGGAFAAFGGASSERTLISLYVYGHEKGRVFHDSGKLFHFHVNDFK